MFINLYYFDLNSHEFLPYYDLIKPFLQRTMGILLNDNENAYSLTRTFYSKCKHSESYRAIDEIPIFPPKGK